ncbi:multifunctional CCA addition/repair protein [Spiribacter roseus]|uniref:multifunctional CCA addition/repair protein n=1 Tax=Spiribacter roseus TaxID=1855875 RepID=UPI00133053E9|nr:multifunctional CCA addition/repair protein [Spiribacter roseus]KAF0281824.1 multifunctional CCA tRNA nucleotidyl transferase/2'3'-cyclic phosphodiesterase/2'nucleotidase/phosphatase [Spiribacter roseus]
MTTAGLEVYEVGGAVRDRLLGLPVHEHDWVVAGASPEAMTERGFEPVGREFPVFLHPHTHEEYALARTERKTGPGYHGFTFHADPDVSLAADLGRRDLTINAMARAPDGSLIDPFHGYDDLKARRLRHVSPAFREDPVRILRLARFAARLAPLGFEVADETLSLCRGMVANGEVEALVPERVWQETAKALMAPAPDEYIRLLRDCGALAVLMPEVDCLFGIPQPARHHPEIDTGDHILRVLAQAVRLDADLATRFSALVHDLGKGVTPAEQLPGHRGHEARGVPLVKTLCERLRVPSACRDLALGVTRHHLDCHRVQALAADDVLALMEGLDLFRRPERLDPFLLACEADYRGRKGLEDRPYPQAEWLRTAFARCREVDASTFVEAGLSGPAIGRAIRSARIEVITRLQAQRR